MQENEIEQLKKSNESRITGEENIDEIMQGSTSFARIENANML